MSYYNNQNRPYGNQPSVNTKIRTVFSDDAMLTISYWNERISCKISAATTDAQGGKHYRTDGLTFALDSARASAVSVYLERLLKNEIPSVEFDTGIDQLTHITFLRELESSSIVMTICKYNDITKSESQSLHFTFPHEEWKISDNETISIETEFLCLIRILSDGYLLPAAVIHGMNMDKSRLEQRSQYQSRSYNNNGQYYNNPNGWNNNNNQSQSQANITQVNSVDDIFGGNIDDNIPF